MTTGHSQAVFIQGVPAKPLQVALHQGEGVNDVDGGGDADVEGKIYQDVHITASYDGITDLSQLQKLLAETSSSEKRHKIRNAIRQLRHTDS
ncbi:hypothetical protein PoB_005174800, partial [Plakobranchus ocellatus]